MYATNEWRTKSSKEGDNTKIRTTVENLFNTGIIIAENFTTRNGRLLNQNKFYTAWISQEFNSVQFL